MSNVSSGYYRQSNDNQNQGGLSKLEFIDRANLASMTLGSAAVAQTVTYTLASITGGNISFKINELVWTVAYVSSAAATVTAFVAANATGLAGQGITLTDSGSGVMVFTAAFAGTPFTIGVLTAGTAGTLTASAITANTVDGTHSYASYTAVSGTMFQEIQGEIDTMQSDWDGKSQGATGKRSHIEMKVVLVIPKASQYNQAYIDKLKNSDGVILKWTSNTGQKLIFGYDEKRKTQSALYLTETKGTTGKDVSGEEMTELTFTGKQIETPYNYTGS